VKDIKTKTKRTIPYPCGAPLSMVYFYIFLNSYIQQKRGVVNNFIIKATALILMQSLFLIDIAWEGKTAFFAPKPAGYLSPAIEIKNREFIRNFQQFYNQTPLFSDKNKAIPASVSLNYDLIVENIFHQLVQSKGLTGIHLPENIKKTYSLILSYGFLSETAVSILLSKSLITETYSTIYPEEDQIFRAETALMKLKFFYLQHKDIFGDRNPDFPSFFYDSVQEANYDHVRDIIYIPADVYLEIGPLLAHENMHKNQTLAPEFFTEGVAEYVKIKLYPDAKISRPEELKFITTLIAQAGEEAVLKAHYFGLETLTPFLGEERVKYLELLAIIEQLIPVAATNNIFKYSNMLKNNGMTQFLNHKRSEKLFKKLNTYIIEKLKIDLADIEESPGKRTFGKTVNAIADFIMREFSETGDVLPPTPVNQPFPFNADTFKLINQAI